MQYVLAFTKNSANLVGLEISKDTKSFLTFVSKKSRTQTSFFVNFYFFLIFYGKIHSTSLKNRLFSARLQFYFSLESSHSQDI